MDIIGVFTFLLKSAFCFSVLFGFYHFALRKQVFFSRNRLMLLISLILSIVIPSITITFFYNVIQSVPYDADAHLPLDISNTVSSITAGHSLSMLSAVWYTYLAITALMLFRVFSLPLQLLFTISRYSRREKIHGQRVMVTKSWAQTFSFFGIIVMPENDFNRPERSMLIAHEQAHSSQFHSLDLLIAEIYIALFWFNPLSYFFKQALMEVHEYLADAQVIRNGVDTVNYQQLLLDCITTANLPTLSNSFSAKLSKRRFAMISNRPQTRNKRSRLLLFLPLFFALLLTFSVKLVAKYVYVPSSREQTTNVLQNADSSKLKLLKSQCASLLPNWTLLKDFDFPLLKPNETRTIGVVLVNGNQYSIAILSSSINGKDRGVYEFSLTDSDGAEIKPIKREKRDNGLILTYEIQKTTTCNIVAHNTGNNVINVVANLYYAGKGIQTKDEVAAKESIATSNESVATIDTCNQIFFIVDEMPKFVQQGYESAVDYFKKSASQPSETNGANLSGKVFVSFVVDQVGHVTDVKILKKVNPVLDERAMEIVKKMPDWIPGKLKGKGVKVALAYPISFN